MILNYGDREVERFHPLCKRCLNGALRHLGKDAAYVVEHHRYAGKLEMDFAITNKSNGKVACIVEVKRTPSAVKSSRYQYQAMSYLQQIQPALLEHPYYILTNLECSCMFRYDATRPNVYQQMLKPGIVHNVHFSELKTEEEFVDVTSRHFALLLKNAFDGGGDYFCGLDAVVSLLAGAVSVCESEWRGMFARISYEYIRGAMTTVRRKTNLKDIRQYGQKMDAICKAMSKIDFGGIFSIGERFCKIESTVLSGSYQMGKANVDADELVSNLHQVVSRGFESEGEVATDIELGRLMAVVARHYCPVLEGSVCDPAAGSGNLLSCICEAYPEIKPSQIKANDRKSALLQLLTLRLGLKFPNLVSPDNAPLVSAMDVTELPACYFENVKLVVLNPPMVAAVSSVRERDAIYRRMRSIGFTPTTDETRSPLDVAFLELVTRFSADGTVILTLLPRTHLTALGHAAVALRRFLVNDFGLSLIVQYPGTGLFENVVKDTVMVAGVKGSHPARIAMLNTMDAVADTDLQSVSRLLAAGVDGYEGGIDYFSKDSSEFLKNVKQGWGVFDPISDELQLFVERYFVDNEKVMQLRDFELDFYRGKVGNRGLSDLLFMSSGNQLFSVIPRDVVPNLPCGMRNAKLDEGELVIGDSIFLEYESLPPETVEAIVERYLEMGERRGRQPRYHKTEEEIREILSAEERNASAANSILLPRDLRKYGRVYRCVKRTYVSTNFFVLEGLDEQESKLLASWMTTVFYQLFCEFYAKNQEGTRKMEKGELDKTFVPRLSLIPESVKEKIVGEWPPACFLELQSPKANTADGLWAEALFGIHADAILEEAIELLLRKATARNQ